MAAGGLGDRDAQVMAQVMMCVPHAEIHRGHAFSFGHLWTSVGNTSSADILVRTGKKEAHVTFSGAAGGTAYAYLYEAPTVSADGTGLTVFNKKRASSVASQVRAFHTPTVGGVGTALISMLIPGGLKNFTSGGQGQEPAEWILLPDSLYLMRMTNVAGTAQPISMMASFYEVDEAGPYG